MEFNRAKNAKQNMIWGLLSKVVVILGPFVIRSIMIKAMGAEYLGIGSLFSSILQVLNLAELGVSSAIVFSMYDPIAKNEIDKICAIYRFYKIAYQLIGLVILIIGIIILPFVPQMVSGEVPTDINLQLLYMIYLTNTVISYFLFGYKEALLVAHQRSDISSNILTITSIVMYIIQAFFILCFPNYYLYTIIIPISTVASNLIKSYIVKKYYPDICCRGKLERLVLIDLYKRISGLMLVKISQVFRNSFDSIIISSFLGLLAVAKYQNYYYILNAVAVFLGVLSNSIIAGIGNSIVTDTVEKNYGDFKKFYLLYNWISGWCTITLLCLYQDFMKLWMGDEYLLSNVMVVLCCIYFYSMRVGDVAAIYRQASGLWWEDKFRPIIESIINLLLNILLVKKFGISGVLLPTIISIVLINIPWASYILFKHYFKKPVFSYYGRIIWNTLIVMLGSALTYLICSMISVQGIYALVIKMIICIIIPNLVFWLIYSKTQEYDAAKTLVMRMLKKDR